MRSSTSFIAALGFVAAGSVAFAAPNPPPQSQTHLVTYEDILYPDDTVNSYHTSHQEFGNGPLQWNYPPASSVNSSAYVNPYTGVMRVLAESNTFHENIATDVGGAFPPAMDRPRAGGQVDYTHKLIIGAGDSGKQVGDPVTLQVTFHLDGWLNMAIPRMDAGKIHNTADMRASFRVVDNSLSGEFGDNPVLVDFDASAHREQYETVPGEVNYPVDGATFYNHKYKWDLTANAMAEGQHFLDQDDQVLPYNWNANGGTTLPYQQAKQFDTGTLVATFTTRVGATLDVSALLGVDAFSYSNFQTQATRVDFSNTFAINFTAAPESEGISIFSTAVLPEPTCLTFLAAGTLLAVRRRGAR